MKRTVLIIGTLLLVPALVWGFGCAKPAPAPALIPTPTTAPAPKSVSAADFYSTNTLTIIVGMKAGASADFDARVLGAFWPDATGGTVKIKNMESGAGIAAANTVFHAKPDGLTLGLWTQRSMFLSYLLKEPGVEYDIGKSTYIIGINIEPHAVGIAAKLPYGSVADLQKAKGLKFGATAIATEISAALFIKLFGLDAVIIPGYGSAPEVGLACARGEVDGYAASLLSISTEVAKGNLKPIIVLDDKKVKSFPNTPTFPELTKPSPEDDEMLKVYAPLNGRMVYGPPGLPEDKVQFLRDTFMKIARMAAFRQYVSSQWSNVEAVVPGNELAATMVQVSATPEKVLAALAQVNKKYVRR